MSIIIDPIELEQLRVLLENYPDAITALDELEDCEGDLEDAAIALAIQVGQEPDTSDRWIDGLAKRWRHVICRADLKQQFGGKLSVELLTALTAGTTLPMKLAVPVALYVLKTDVGEFCRPFEEAKVQPE